MEITIYNPLVHLTAQEQKIISYLQGKDVVAWEELAQFAKDPQTVKMKSLQRAVSDIKRKFAMAGLPIPFSTKFTVLVEPKNATTASSGVEQGMVQMRRTRGGKRVPATNTELDARLDFRLDPAYHVVISIGRGRVKLTEGEFEIFQLLYNNAGKPVSIEQMRDACFPRGSLCPPTWSNQISSALTKLRKNLPELKSDNRLLTVASSHGSTSYMLV